MSNKRLLLLLLFVGLPGACWYYSSSTTTSSRAQVNDLSSSMVRGEVRTLCENAARVRLKAPATAEFPRANPVYAAEDRNVYRVISYVDAQNSFGALIRMHFQCDVSRSAQGLELKRWSEIPQ